MAQELKLSHAEDKILTYHMPKTQPHILYIIGSMIPPS